MFNVQLPYASCTLCLSHLPVCLPQPRASGSSATRRESRTADQRSHHRSPGQAASPSDNACLAACSFPAQSLPLSHCRPPLLLQETVQSLQSPTRRGGARQRTKRSRPCGCEFRQTGLTSWRYRTAVGTSSNWSALAACLQRGRRHHRAKSTEHHYAERANTANDSGNAGHRQPHPTARSAQGANWQTGEKVRGTHLAAFCASASTWTGSPLADGPGGTSARLGVRKPWDGRSGRSDDLSGSGKRLIRAKPPRKYSEV